MAMKKKKQVRMAKEADLFDVGGMDHARNQVMNDIGFQ